jgi:putative (di)nucleoside polyphosphate hydrolase
MTPTDLSKLGYRPCVGVMLLNRDGLVWVGRRADSKNLAEGHGDWWQMPQGGIDEGEDPAKAVLRELAEETSIRSVRIIGESAGWHYYDLPPELIGKAWGGRYRGQKQKWFAMRFLGDDAEVDLAPPGHAVEFEAWRWAPIDELERLIIPFKRDVYRTVIAEFRHLARPEET